MQTWVLLLVLTSCFAPPVKSGILHGFGKKSNVLYDDSSRTRGFEDRSATRHDFVLGGLFAVHYSTGGCSTWRGRGAEDVEAMLFAIDRINADAKLLPNISLGYDVRDTCQIDSVGLEESLDLVIRGSRFYYQGETDRLPTVGIVGPSASQVSIPSAGLGQLFKMPQVSYASSSPDLSDKERYGYFRRTIPPDTFQAQAIIDLLLHFNWTLVSIVYSSNSYGVHGRDEINSLVMDHDICVDVDQGIGNDWSQVEYRELAERLTQSGANVVIGFFTSSYAERLFSIFRSLTQVRQLTWIASDAWSDSTSVIQEYGNSLTGFLGVSAYNNYVEDFQAYFSNLSIESNQRNAWFPGYFAFLADCNLIDGECNNTTSIPHLDNYAYEQNSYVPLIIDAVYTFAHALHQYLLENCDPPLQWNRTRRTCRGYSQRELDGATLLGYMQNIHFKSLSGNDVEFDINGDVKGIYSIITMQTVRADNDTAGVFSVKEIGIWNGTTVTGQTALSLTPDSLQFGMTVTDNQTAVTSHCPRCSLGHVRKQLPSSCCGTCVPCLDQNYSVDPTSFTCQICAEGSWGNHPLMGSNVCLHIEEVYLDFSSPWSISIMLLSSFGLIAVTVTLAIFCKYWNTPLVKSSGREQMMLLLVGITVCFCTAFLYVAPPSLGTCIIQRFGLWICYSLMFGAILIKIIRVARIFLKKPTNSKKIYFAEPQYLVLFTLLIVLGETLLSVGSVVYHHPVVDRYFQQRHNENPVYILTCTTDPIPFLVILVAYVSTTIIAATILGVISYKFPRNFNEAKHVTFCTLSLLLTWIGFIPSYLATVSLHIVIQNAVIAIAIVMSAFIVLLSLYGPKIYIILFRPMKNSLRYSTDHPPPMIIFSK